MGAVRGAALFRPGRSQLRDFPWAGQRICREAVIAVGLALPVETLFPVGGRVHGGARISRGARRDPRGACSVGLRVARETVVPGRVSPAGAAYFPGAGTVIPWGTCPGTVFPGARVPWERVTPWGARDFPLRRVISREAHVGFPVGALGACVIFPAIGRAMGVICVISRGSTYFPWGTRNFPWGPESVSLGHVISLKP